MTMLTRDAILAADDVKTKDVEVPEWGGSVRVRGLTAGDRLRMVDTQKPGTSPLILWIVAATIDDKGAALFQPADVEALMHKSAAATDRVYAAIAELNGLGAKAVEAATKN